MEYRNRDTGQLVTQAEFLSANQHLTPPAVWGLEWLNFCGLDPVFESPAPAVSELEVALRNGVERDAKGNFVYAWVIKPLFEDKITLDGTVLTRQAQESAYLATKRANLAASVRAERDRRLSETDWLVIRSAEAGIPLTTEQLEYRQALRDVTKQAGFPVNVDWPALE